ncbi:MAG: TetR/AcrR family transcriptional regulator [Beduini sp.]|uniref:TetR/AcrR family transcriptional regulator n=1 Tax=Beduini sp. TaxID=1922300 RepID=UPI0039A1EC69
MNEKFYSLSLDMQQSIINAGMQVFAENDYKNASADLIASKAGIPKGLLFYYFQNKKELYLYIYHYLAEIMIDQIVDIQLKELTDFFEILRYAAHNKVKALQKNPSILDFAMRAFYLEKESVAKQVNAFNNEQENLLYNVYFGQIDEYKFKAGVEPYRVYKMIRWMADGFVHDMRISGKTLNLEVMEKAFNEWLVLMKKLAYKEKYQDECY